MKAALFIGGLICGAGGAIAADASPGLAIGGGLILGAVLAFLGRKTTRGNFR